MSKGWVIKVPLETGEWMTVTYFGQDDNILPCIYESYEQAKEASLMYNECKIEEYKPPDVKFF